MKKNLPIAILGGTFDPVHNGHLRLVIEILNHFHVQEIRMIPCKQNVLKKEKFSSDKNRLTLLKKAIKDISGVVIDDRELKRKTPSYTIDTLRSLKAEFPKKPLWLILGSDLIEQLPRWHEWESLLEYAHFFIIERPGFEVSAKNKLMRWIQKHRVYTIDTLYKKTFGKIFITDLFTLLPISSTQIRASLKKKQDIRYLLPENVLKFIENKKLY